MANLIKCYVIYGNFLRNKDTKIWGNHFHLVSDMGWQFFRKSEGLTLPDSAVTYKSVWLHSSVPQGWILSRWLRRSIISPKICSNSNRLTGMGTLARLVSVNSLWRLINFKKHQKKDWRDGFGKFLLPKHEDPRKDSRHPPHTSWVWYHRLVTSVLWSRDSSVSEMH